MWMFNPQKLDLEWTMNVEYSNQEVIGSIDFGLNGDLGIDTGDRENDQTVMDQGLRVV